tara:strand:+ start:279 stop:1259 length:981 start_codon:yes stop_codon:yes gene_type:complete
MSKRIPFSIALVALIALGGSPFNKALAQALTEAAPPQEVAVPMAAFVAPLEALSGEEEAFVNKLESLGDEEVIRLNDLDNRLRGGGLTPEVATQLQTELRDCLAKLGTLCDVGLQHYAENARVRNFRGNVFYDNLGRQDDAVKEWHMATAIDSDFAEPFNNLGMYYFHCGRYPLGFQNMDKALELEPDNADFNFNLAQNYLIYGPQIEKHRGWNSKRVYKEAMKLSKRAIKTAPDDYQLLEDYAVNFMAAENFGVKADWKDAAQAWQAAREHAPDNVKTFFTWLNEGRMWKNMGKKKEALACFEEALKIMPHSDVVRRLINELKDT